jgi:hypothetical protein
MKKTNNPHQLKEYIIAAAIWYSNDIKYPHQPINVETGFVVLGKGHHNCIATTKILSGKNTTFEEQGFLTNLNRFVSREEGAKIAYAFGQIAEQKETLYSEDIYTFTSAKQPQRITREQFEKVSDELSQKTALDLSDDLFASLKAAGITVEEK